MVDQNNNGRWRCCCAEMNLHSPSKNSLSSPSSSFCWKLAAAEAQLWQPLARLWPKSDANLSQWAKRNFWLIFIALGYWQNSSGYMLINLICKSVTLILNSNQFWWFNKPYHFRFAYQAAALPFNDSLKVSMCSNVHSLKLCRFGFRTSGKENSPFYTKAKRLYNYLMLKGML